MQFSISRLAGSVVDLLFPLSCLACKREGRFLCVECESGLARLEKPYCSLCASPGRSAVCSWCAAAPPSFEGISAPYRMKGPVSEMVRGLKYRGVKAWAPHMAKLMARHLESRPVPADTIVPVPLHRRRKRARGYNQSEVLARELSERAGLPLSPKLLRRVRDTPPQVSMTSNEDRRQNVVGAFEWKGDAGGLRVLVVDDVVTTGATISACASALKAGGAVSVWGLSLAR